MKDQADGPVYAPFQDYGGRELRAQQGYLAKFPAALVPVLLGAEYPGSPNTEPADERHFIRPSARQGYISDAAVRTAVEKRAVHLARIHYIQADASEIEELGKPYDMRVVLNGVERHVDVKGATGIGVDSVQLTQGEVDHAHSHQPTDLFVVEQINVARDDAGEVTASGGVVRLWEEWAPADSSLRPTHLRYKLPDM